MMKTAEQARHYRQDAMRRALSWGLMTLLTAVMAMTPPARPAQASTGTCEQSYIAIPLAAGYFGAFIATMVGLRAAASKLQQQDMVGLAKDMSKTIDRELSTPWTNALNEFWEDRWLQALMDMTKQLSTSMVKQNMLFGMNTDANTAQTAKRIHEMREEEMIEEFTPDEDGCIVDTLAGPTVRALQYSRALSTTMSTENMHVMTAQKGTVGERGAAGLTAARWDRYLKHFCDKDSNLGAAGCEADGDFVNAHITPGKTLFSAETIEKADEEKYRHAVNALVYYLTDYKTMDQLSPGMLQSSATGLASEIKNREYIAQMDVAGSLVYGIAGERTPGIASPDVKMMREMMHVTTAAEKPGLREIRKAIVEQLWNPLYYIRLGGGKAEVARREAYLQSYNTQMLYALIERMERISWAYAIESANMLGDMQQQHSARSRHVIQRGTTP